jgi:hypothetical protein
MGHLPHGSRALLDSAVEALPGLEERRVAREDRVVEATAESVRDGNPQVGSPLPLRLEVGRAHDVGREPGLRITLEEVELPWTRELDLVCELAPVLRAEGVGAVDDLAERLRRHVAAEVDAVVAEATRRGG